MLQLNNIPQELKSYPQWVLWKYKPTKSGKPTKPPYSPKTGNLVSHHPKDRELWGSYDETVEVFEQGGYEGLGFVLTKNDPFCVIDIDSVKDSDHLAFQNEIWGKTNSFSESSPSKKGAHIWLKGSIPQGRKRYSTEIYSTLRYITVTGDVIKGVEIIEDQPLIDDVFDKLAPPQKSTGCPQKGVTAPPTQTDDMVIDRAMSAFNGAKFRDCWNGDWRTGGYPSPSENDFALVDMIGFYTQDHEQIRRIFLSSPAAQRSKYEKGGEYRIARMVNQAHDRDINALPPMDCLPMKSNIDSQVEALREAKVKKIQSEEMPFEEYIPDDDFYPPGLIGEVAEAIYNFAPLPVKEIALTGAIGFMAGICGRCFNFKHSGLNLYLLLVAPSGVGKEAMKDGIDMLYGEIEKRGVKTLDFKGPMKIASEQALISRLNESRTKSFLSIYGEIGKELQKMVDGGKNNSAIDMNKLLLTMYSASGQGKLVDEMIYADKSKNTDQIKAPAFSILGQSVPSQVYKAMSEELITDGLLPRFIFREYPGPRVYFNENVKAANQELITKLADLVSISIMLNDDNSIISVQIDDEAATILRDLETYCTDWINDTKDEIVRALYNRVGLNVRRLAALIAVGRNHHKPIITKLDVDWAKRYIMQSVRNLISKAEDGSLTRHGDGISMGHTQTKIMNAVRSWFVKEFSAAEKKILRYPLYRKEAIVPLRFIQQRCGNMKSADFHNALQGLLKAGDLISIPENRRAELYEKYGWANVYKVDIYTLSEDYNLTDGEQ